MPALTNARHEILAQLVAIGKSATVAYREAYGRGTKTAEAASSRLMKNGKVLLRISELRHAVNANREAATLLSLREKRAFLALVVRTPIGEVDEHSPLCQSGEWSEKRRRITMCDKLRAIELDAKLAGELSERIEMMAIVAPLSAAERSARLVALADRRRSSFLI